MGNTGTERDHMKRLMTSLLCLCALMLSACAQAPSTASDPVAELALSIRSLGPDVDPVEARRAAELSYSHAAQLARDYAVTDPPILHNTKVNAGLRERGLCYHYAEDMQARLDQEGFESLTILRAIAEPRNAFRIEHSSPVIAARGGDIYDGIVLDAWRHGGALFWAPTVEDTRYDWEPRMDVLRRKQERRVASGEVTG